MGQYTPLAVANTFLKEKGAINHLKLQKLVYLCYCWWLTYKDEPFIGEPPQVWRHGPVFQSLYIEFKDVGMGMVEEARQYKKHHINEADTDIQDLMFDFVWGRYGSLSPVELSALTHVRGSPWHQVASAYNFDVPNETAIPITLIIGHYRNVINERFAPKK